MSSTSDNSKARKEEEDNISGPLWDRNELLEKASAVYGDLEAAQVLENAKLWMKEAKKYEIIMREDLFKCMVNTLKCVKWAMDMITKGANELKCKKLVKCLAWMVVNIDSAVHVEQLQQAWRNLDAVMRGWH